MIASFGERLSGIAERYMPDPFVFAILLTILTFALGVASGQAVTDLPLSERAGKLADGWFASFYKTGLMKFAMQMCIVLITGHALALSAPVQRAIAGVCRLAKTSGSAVVIVALVSAMASVVQWGLGVIVGAFIAREMGKQFAREGKPVHYPLLGAAGYAGFMVWHGGFSGSAPLKVAEPGHTLVDAIGVIPITETILSPLNLAVTGSLIVVIAAALWWIRPRDPDHMVGYTGPLDDASWAPEHAPRGGVIGVLEGSRLLNLALALGLFAWCVRFFAGKGLAGLNLDTINLIFLALGLALHRSPRDYVAAVVDGARGCAGILLQFPFYFGILGLLVASGLIVQLSDWFVEISTPTTFSIFTFLSAGLVNFLVPSGGGQWAVQGPIMMSAVKELGVEPSRAIMAMSYGDAWTNMLQPFWALPLLGIMRLEARQIVGYTAFVLLVTGPVIICWLLLF